MKNLKNKSRRFRKGISLIELVVAIGISVIPISTVAILLVSSLNSINKTYTIANRRIENDGQDATVVFGKIGRKSIPETCTISSLTGRPRASSVSASTVISGSSIMFGYNTIDISTIDTSKIKINRSSRNNVKPSSLGAMEYAFFYLNRQENKLKVDYSNGGSVTKTVVLADNVMDVRFSRTIMNNTQQGCVRMEMTLKDPVDGKLFTVMASTLLRS